METAKLKKFAQFARRSLIEQVSVKFGRVIAENSVARRENAEAIKKLGEAIEQIGKEQVIERVAYIWFNRFCALRFMDANRYTRIGVVSPSAGQFQPEILAEAKNGHVDEEMVNSKICKQIFSLLDGQAPSHDPQGEVYRLLLVAVCNYWHGAMPFLFERIDDYTELLMPDDLLSGNSILAYTREAMTSDVCQDVEVIGWLYQFYISEKKDEVFEGLKKNKKIRPENIPAATQLFTPHWIVRYLVENSLGRLWMLNRPGSRLAEKMEYYVGEVESGKWGVGSGKEEVESGKWGVGREEWEVGSGKEEVESGKWGVGREEWEVGSGKEEVESGKWGVGSEEWEVRSGKEEVESGKWGVGSEEWEVRSVEKCDGGAKLSGADCLAESNGLGGVGLSGNQDLSQGGTLRIDESGKTSSGLDSVQHSGRSSSSINSGVQKFSIHSARIESRSRNANHDSPTTELSPSRTNQPNPHSIGGNQTNAPLTNHETKITPHSPLSTISSHSSLPTSHLILSSPEEILLCDPACGSGHMLTYAFDLLYAIYEEEGYEPAEIPEKILTHNLYGIEIDERAGELAAFALTMKARAKHRRFFRKSIQPNICALEKIEIVNTNEPEWTQIIDAMCGKGVDRVALMHDLSLFTEADNFGSLLKPKLSSEQSQNALAALTSYDESIKAPSLEHWAIVKKCKTALMQADYLSQKYHVVIANPPYMGGKGMNARLGAWAKENYPDTKSDLFAMFVERNLDLAIKQGVVAMITMQSWMFLSSFEALRARLLGKETILSMAHLGAKAFDSIGGEVVSTTAFVLENANRLDYKGGYLRLITGNSEAEKEGAIREAIKNPNCGWFYRASAEDFKKIPGSPIAYWAPSSVIRSFEKSWFLDDLVYARIALATGDNGRFVRLWPEVSIQDVGFDIKSNEDSVSSGRKWFPCNKGGEYRKWYGNNDSFVNWFNDGKEIKSLIDTDTGRIRSHNYNLDFGFKESVTWSALSSSKLGARYSKPGFMFVTPGSSAFKKNRDTNILVVQSLLSSNVADYFLRLISATMNIEVGNILRIPVLQCDVEIVGLAKSAIELAKSDWDSYETSWDFTTIPLLQATYHQASLSTAYKNLRADWQNMTLEMQRLEEENNRIFIDAYGLQDELSPEVPLKEITLTCNPYYRYGVEEWEGGRSEKWKVESGKEEEVRSGKWEGRRSEKWGVGSGKGKSGEWEGKKWEEMDARLLQDTMKELVSYAVGCMFGRYALEKPGLILANQGETLEDYLKQIPEPKFSADKDNVIPMLDGDWFVDDISDRFRKFLRIVFGEDHYEDNLKFIEKALGKNGKSCDIRNYFLKDFYSDHVKRYKKRPIYWLFSSPKGSFNALIYMHRYRPDTASIVLNDYLREFRTKLASHKNYLEAMSISASASQGEKTKALKEIEKINKMIAEMEDYERDVLYPLATRQIAIDLDDGVKVNYPKFGAALKTIPGLEAKEE